MGLISLEIQNFRNLLEADVYPDEGLNLIIGDNGSGKSSLLESIFFLGTGRSFRTSKPRELINFASESLFLGGTIKKNNGVTNQIGIGIGRDFMKVKINGSANRFRSSLAQIIPIQIINPASFDLIEGGPKYRRQFLDYGLFHVEPSFLGLWRKYNRALQQRNVVLKLRNEKELVPWNRQLVDSGVHLTELRKQYFEKYSEFVKKILGDFLPFQNVELIYNNGWRKQHTFASAIAAEQKKDIEMGFTGSGPHRADFLISVQEREAKRFLSRGQIKILIIAIKLAQLKLFKSIVSNSACILVDDLASELGNEYRHRVMEILLGLNSQVFITAISDSVFDKDISKKKVFHVEHGSIIPS